MKELKEIRLGNIFDATGGNFAGMVYSYEGLSPTVDTCQGGYRQPMIIEDFYQGRNLRVYRKYAPTIRADRQGLKVLE